MITYNDSESIVKLEDPVVYADIISLDEVSDTEVNVTKLFSLSLMARNKLDRLSLATIFWLV